MPCSSRSSSKESVVEIYEVELNNQQQSDKINKIPIEDEILSYNPFLDSDYSQLILIVDGREKSTNIRKKDVVKSLETLNVPFQLRSLSIGDYLWVLKMNDKNRSGANDELVLDYIVERKTWDDLKVCFFFKVFDIIFLTACRSVNKNQIRGFKILILNYRKKKTSKKMTVGLIFEYED